VRAAFRLVPYVWAVWRALGRCDVVHVFANSGWAWYLFAQPALTIGRLRGVPVIVNYRGGVAEEFLGHAPRWVLRSLSRAALRVTPSAFLRRVFAQHGLQAQIVPNIIDTDRFRAQTRGTAAAGPHLIVTRNLEPIYDLPTALQAFARIRALHPTARLTIAGSGPQRSELESLALRLGLGEAVTFSGRIDNQRIPQLYASADLMLNSSTVDNMPISILEALASGVPVVTTSAGGITDFVTDGVTALIVPVGDHEAMAAAALRVLADPLLADGLRAAGQREVRRYAWPQVRQQWQMAYQSVLVRPAHQSVLP
jgi:glycosyltransferase involved in cell wall biosynthesis